MIKGAIATIAVFAIVISFVSVLLAPMPVVGQIMQPLSVMASSIILLSSFVIGYSLFNIPGGLVAVMAMTLFLILTGFIVV